MIKFSHFREHAPPEILIDRHIAFKIVFDELDGSGFAWRTGDFRKTMLELKFLSNGCLRSIAQVGYADPLVIVNSSLPRRFIDAKSIQPAVPVEIWDDYVTSCPLPKPIDVLARLACQCYTDGMRLDLVPDGQRSPIWICCGRASLGLDSQLQLAAIEISDIDPDSLAVMKVALSM